VDSALHLGNFIGANAFEKSLQRAQNELIGRVCFLHARFRVCSYDVLRTLFISYCTSFYGSSLWKLKPHDLEPLSIAWRKSIRRLLDLSSRTHSRYIPYNIIALPDVSIMLCNRFRRFFSRCLFSPNPLIAVCARLSFSSVSIVNNNINQLCSLLNVSHDSLIDCLLNNTCKKTLYEKSNLNVQTANVCHTIVELIKMRKYELMSPLTPSEAAELLNYLCVN
jgi:hypothetical protein